MSTLPNPLPTDPCQLCALLQQQYYLLVMGAASVEVESPQLGRVSYNKADLPTLKAAIDGLAAQCVQAGGTLPAGVNPQSRHPISVEEYTPPGRHRWGWRS